MSAIDACIENNAAYAAGLSKRELPSPPSDRLAIVTCMDARMDLYSILGLDEGDAHVIRNAGGVVTDDVIRSLTISQRLLGTREVMLICHTNCGMLTFTDDDLTRELQQETGIRPSFAIGTFPDLDAEVRISVTRLVDCPFLIARDAVRGFVYDVETGLLREVTP